MWWGPLSPTFAKEQTRTGARDPEQHPGAAGSRHAVSGNLSPVLHVLVSPETRKFVSLTTLPGAVSCGAQLGCGSSPAQGRQRAAIQTMFDSPS